MSGLVSPDHPRVWLSLIAQGHPTASQQRDIAAAVSVLTLSRQWSIQPPVAIGDENEGVDAESGSSSHLAIGGALELYSAYPAHPLPVVIDRHQLDDSEAFIAAFWALSDRTGLSFDAEYAEERVGAIKNGQIDRALGVLFLDEWRKGLESREAAGR